MHCVGKSIRQANNKHSDLNISATACSRSSGENLGNLLSLKSYSLQLTMCIVRAINEYNHTAVNAGRAYIGTRALTESGLCGAVR
jgi:hypothetical protein